MKTVIKWFSRKDPNTGLEIYDLVHIPYNENIAIIKTYDTTKLINRGKNAELHLKLRNGKSSKHILAFHEALEQGMSHAANYFSDPT